MNDHDLDTIYTHLCRTMTNLGQGNAQLFLARFALLTIAEIGNVAVAQRLIADASDGLGQ